MRTAPLALSSLAQIVGHDLAVKPVASLSGLPPYTDFVKTMRQVVGGRPDVSLKVTKRLRYTVAGQNHDYDSIKITSKGIRKKDPVLLIRAGIHGDETPGPMTLFRHLDKIIDRAHSRGVKLVIFPLDNPSGFTAGTRYNIEGDHGDAGNNDFLRYKLKDGRFVDDLRTGNEFTTWHWTSDPTLGIRLPQETRNLHRELKRLPLSQVKAVLDLHADNFMLGASAYHYAFGDTSVYLPIIQCIQGQIPVLANTEVNSGYLNEPEYRDERVEDGRIVPTSFSPRTDAFGAIVRHDGSLGDLFDRLGTRHSITVEVTQETGPEVADWVNLSWIYGLIELVAAEASQSDHSGA